MAESLKGSDLIQTNHPKHTHTHPSPVPHRHPHGWSRAGEQGKSRKTGRWRWGTVCRTWLFRSVDPIRRAVTCFVRGHVPPERHKGGWTRRRGRVLQLSHLVTFGLHQWSRFQHKVFLCQTYSTFVSVHFICFSFPSGIKIKRSKL